MSSPRLSADLCRFVAGLRYEALPGDVVAAAKRSLVNFFAVAYAGAGTEALTRLSSRLAAISGPGPCTVIGSSQRQNLLDAAFLNCAGANVYDFDDTHIPTIIHPTAPVAAALLALAETRPIDGRTFVTAFVAGVEIECHLGLALHPGHYRRGWHITSTCGIFGAAMACGHAMGPSPRQLLAALGHASAQASGIVETLGTDSKSIGMGNAARNGVLSALLAADGLTGPDHPLEGEHGFLRVFGEPSADALDGLGARWEILNNTYKPYPCGIVLNPVIDACLLLRGQAGLAPGRIARIVVTGNTLLRERTDRPNIVNGRQSQVSAQHATAVTLLRGQPGIAEFSDTAVAAADIAQLRGKVEIHVDDTLPVGVVRIEATLDDGSRLAADIGADAHSVRGLVTDAELAAKFHTLAAPLLGQGERDHLLQTLAHLENVADATALLHPAGS
jgi:2-methylcitrate dehydratase PrpD